MTMQTGIGFLIFDRKPCPSSGRTFDNIYLKNNMNTLIFDATEKIQAHNCANNVIVLHNSERGATRLAQVLP